MNLSAWIIGNAPHISVWIGAFCTLALYSILYKENKIYRFAEHIYLGLATGYAIANGYNEVLYSQWQLPLLQDGKWWYIFALIFAGFYYFIFTKKFNWLSRLAIGLILGVTAGRAFQEFTNDIWPQIPKSFKPIIPHGAIAATANHPAINALNVPDALNNLLFMVIMITVMS